MVIKDYKREKINILSLKYYINDNYENKNILNSISHSFNLIPGIWTGTLFAPAQSLYQPSQCPAKGMSQRPSLVRRFCRLIYPATATVKSVHGFQIIVVL